MYRNSQLEHESNEMHVWARVLYVDISLCTVDWLLSGPWRCTTCVPMSKAVTDINLFNSMRTCYRLQFCNVIAFILVCANLVFVLNLFQFWWFRLNFSIKWFSNRNVTQTTNCRPTYVTFCRSCTQCTHASNIFKYSESHLKLNVSQTINYINR